MNFESFNFLEDTSTQIIKLLHEQMLRQRPAFAAIPDASLKQMLEQIVDGYIDLAVTGQSDTLDKPVRCTDTGAGRTRRTVQRCI